jgi:hypothetical protein
VPQFFSKALSSRAGVTTVITMSAGSQATAAFGAQTYQIRVSTGAQPAFIKIGDGTPTAGTGDMILGANVVDYFSVTPGQKAAVVQGGTAGTISITEMS